MEQRLFSKVVLVLLIMGIHFSLVGQQSSVQYDLRHYEVPYLERQVLELQFDLSSENRYLSSEQYNQDQEKSEENVFHAFLNPFYSYYLNTPKFQLEQRITGNMLDFSSSGSKSEDEESKNKEFLPDFSFNSENRVYLKDKAFIETDLSLDCYYNYASRDYKEMDDIGELILHSNQINKTNSIQSSLPLMAGWGRIEYVEDARLAVYILDDLNKAGKLSRELSEEEITDFAHFISYLQNERFFDDREKKIWELQQIDSFLTANQLIIDQDVVAFTLINDNWDYANGPVREKGFRVAGGVRPQFYRYGTTSEEETVYPDTIISIDDDYYNRLSFGIGPILSLTYEIPINLFWQFSFTNDLLGMKTYEKQNHNQYNSDTTMRENGLSIYNSLRAGFGYYPNSRTSFSLHVSETMASTHTSFDDLTMEDDDFTMLTSLSLGINYYISPQLRFNASGGIANYYLQNKTSDVTTEESNNNQLNLNFSATLTYKIF